MDLDIGIAFVILEPDIVLGAMFLDEVHLEDQGLKFRADQDPLQINDLPDEPSRFGIVTGICVKIRADAVPKADRLTHVNDRPRCVFHKIAAWLRWKRCEDALELF